MDRQPEIHAAATLVQLAAPADGASFTDRWNTPSEPAVDVSATTPETPALPEPEKG